MRHYVLASAALGALAVWGSENLFWSAPPEGISPAGLALTWAAYAVCAAAALSAVLATGIQGWRAAFLGGAVLGWLVEGVVVGTIYAGFPFQLVWTPLAWHALVTGLLVIGGGRAAAHWPAPRRRAAWAALGLGAGLWAAYWPLEREEMPGLAVTAGYLVGVGLVVPAAHLALDRIGTLRAPSRRVLLIAPGLVTVTWLLQVALAPTPAHVALPVLLAIAWWTMRRLGADPPTGLALGGTDRARRHLDFLIAPMVATLVAGLLWALAPQGLPVHVPVALVTCTASVWLFVRLVREARRAQVPGRR